MEEACAITYAGVADLGGFGKDGCAVREAEEFFAKVCLECDQRMGEPAACRWFLNWHDETPREEMRACLLPEVKLEIARREGKAPEDVGEVA